MFLTNQTTVTYKLLSNLPVRQPPSKGINDLSMRDIQKLMGEQLSLRKFVVRKRYKFGADLKQKTEETI